MMQPELKGEQLILRRPRRSDAELITNYLSNRQVSRWLPNVPKPYRLEDAYRFVRSAARLVKTDKCLPLGLHHRQEDHLVGMIALTNLNSVDRSAEIGYWIARPFWRTGLASEAMNLLVCYAFSRKQKFHRVYAWVHSENLGSIRVLERSGFVREGTCRQASRVTGRWKDDYLYAQLRNDRSIVYIVYISYIYAISAYYVVTQHVTLYSCFPSIELRMEGVSWLPRSLLVISPRQLK